MIKSLVKKLALLTILIVLLMPLILYGLLGTETGTRWLIQQMVRVESLGASVGNVEGTLLERLVLTNVHYRSETELVTLDNLSFDWDAPALLNGTLHIRAISGTNLSLGVYADAETPQDESEFSLPNIPFKIQIDLIDLQQLRYKDNETEMLVDRIQLAADLQNQNARLTLLEVETPELKLRGQGEVLLVRELPVTARIEWLLRLPETPEITGQTNLEGNLEQLTMTGAVDGAVHLDHRLVLRLMEAQPVIDFSGRWKKLQWPLSGPPQISSPEGRIKLSGTAEDYRIELDTNLAADTLPPFAVTLKGQGNTQSLNVSQLALTPKQGRFDLNGQVSWADAVVFDLKILADRINPGDFVQEVPGSLNLRAAASGQVIDGRLSGNIAIDRLDGKLQGHPVNARGKLAVKGDQVQVDKLHVRSGKNQVTADGQLNPDKAQLQFEIDAPDLTTVWPGLAGSIKGSGSVRGQYLNPVIVMSLTAERLRFDDYAISRLELAVDYAEALKRPSKVSLFGQELIVAGKSIDRLSLEGTGSFARHHFQTQIHSAEVKLDLAIVGAFENKHWEGTINQLALDHQLLHRWQLADPWPVDVRQQPNDIVIELPRGCLIQQEASLCLSLNGSANGQMQADAEVRGLDLALLNPWLPEDLSIKGLLSAEAEAFKQGEILTARLQIDIPEPHAKVARTNQEPLAVPLSLTRLEARYQQERISADLRMGLSGEDFVSAQIETGIQQHERPSPISGNLQATINDMTFFDTLIPEVEKLKGRFNADLRISGDTENPVVSGLGRFSEAGMAVPLAGITIKNLDLQVASNGQQSDRLIVTGQASSGKGALTINGIIDLVEEQGFPVVIRVEGNDFEIAKQPQAEIAVSPKLQIEQQHNRTKVTGNVAIDKASLVLNEIPESAVAPSEDEIIVGVNDTGAAPKSMPPIQSDILIDLGEQVNFSGYGLTTRLTGKLRYTGTAKQQRMQGRVAMSDAKYKAYGQDLTLTKGEFLFNGPADNPWLNIEATRKATGEDITAILRVTGPLKSPETKVSTEPKLPESEALAYLLTGRSLQRVGDSQSNTLAKAAFSYGAGQLSWLSDQMGIDEFEVEEAERLEDSAVRLGKYINPDFYIGLSLGFFSNNYAVLFKQQLNKYFSLQTRAGETQRIDLKYQLDTD